MRSALDVFAHAWAIFALCVLLGSVLSSSVQLPKGIRLAWVGFLVLASSITVWQLASEMWR